MLSHMPRCEVPAEQSMSSVLAASWPVRCRAVGLTAQPYSMPGLWPVRAH